MARLVDALLHPISQIGLLIAIITVGGVLITRPTQKTARPLHPQITAEAGGMMLPPDAAVTAVINDQIATQQPTPRAPASQSPVQLAPTFSTFPVFTATLTADGALLPAPTATRHPLSAIPTMRDGPVCACSGDSYSCAELGERAQACYDYCVAQGQGDVHRLDYNQNGIVCEE